jgi:hypothetical protein
LTIVRIVPLPQGDPATALATALAVALAVAPVPALALALVPESDLSL